MTSLYKEYAQSWGIFNNELHVDKKDECGLDSKPVWVHWVDGHFMIEPFPDPFPDPIY